MVNERTPSKERGVRLGCDGSAVQICPSRPLHSAIIDGACKVPHPYPGSKLLFSMGLERTYRAKILSAEELAAESSAERT